MVTNADFQTGPLADFGITVTHTPVTTNIHNVTGEKFYTDGTTANMSVVMENANRKYSFDKQGLTDGADARMFVKGDVTISKNDKILHNSITYRVDTVSEKLFGSNVIYKAVLLFKIS